MSNQHHNTYEMVGLNMWARNEACMLSYTKRIIAHTTKINNILEGLQLSDGDTDDYLISSNDVLDIKEALHNMINDYNLLTNP